MLYEKEKYYPLGEQFLAVDFGDEGTLEENIFGISIAHKVKEASVPGVIDIVPVACELMIGYDPDKIRYLELVHKLERWANEFRERKGKIQIPSRIITLPVLYGDKWTRECAEQHGVPPNLQVAAEYNNVSVEEFIKLHTSQTYWVRYLGFFAGLAGFISLTPERELRAPKYKKPRTWTPGRTLGLGGNSNSIYPSEIPGGVQMLGRLPVPTFDIESRHPAFKDGPALLRAGDRIKLISITEEEYTEIEKNSATYEYQITQGLFEFELGGEKNGSNP
jgi:KipI family sensor histidine kinase inhibitor